MFSDSSPRARLAWLMLAPFVAVGCEAVLSLGPEPDRDRASGASSSDAASSTSSGGPGGAGQGGSDGQGGGASSASSASGASTSSSSTGPGGGSAYAAVVAEDSPLVYLRLGDAEGPIAAAAVGEPGTYLEAEADAYGFGAPGAIAGDADTAVRFDGGGIVLGDAFDPSGTAPFTFEAWVEPSGAMTGDFQRIFSKELAAGGREGVVLWIDNGTMRIERFLDDVVQYASTTGLPTDRFLHAVATFDGQDVALYVDGEPADGQIYGELVQVREDLDALHVGVASYGLEHFFRGAIDEVAVYDFALSPGRIRLHFQVGTGAL